MEPIIEFKQVTKEFEGQIVLKDLELEIYQREIFVLVGPSGSGKTTSLKMINGLIEPTDGNVFFKKKRVKDYQLQKLRWKIGYVLQQIALFPTMSVKENIEVIPEMLGWSKAQRNQRVDELLTEVGLDPETFKKRMPAELSGGQSQRIGILRALAAEPDIILMDEPFSALDPISRTNLQDLVLELHQKLGNTIVFVTHNMNEALKLGDRIGVMNEGKLIQCDTPEKIRTAPKTAFVRDFFDETQTTQQVPRLQAVIDAGNYQQTVGTQHPALDVETSLSQVFEILASSEALTVTKEKQAIGEVTRSDIFQFLSQEEQNEKL
jgi:osmoprotectant transport system ATP-binding protein